MRTRPFLSHKREDRAAVIALKRQLSIYGIGGWRDLDDLHLGELNQPGFQRAIDHETGGCIWYGTSRVLRSDYINNVELPAVTDRKRREPDYPLVPLFVTITPGEADAGLRVAAVKREAKLHAADIDLFMDSNGEPRGRCQTNAAYQLGVARRYVSSAVRWLDRGSYTVAFAALSEPSGTQDFTFDWRSLVNETTRVLTPDAEMQMRDALAVFRDAVKPSTEFPELTLDVDLPLPLAALAGSAWRPATRLVLTVRQRTRSGIVVVNGDGPATVRFPAWTEALLAGSGPTVIALSTTPQPLTGPLRAYAQTVAARRTLELHIPGELDADGIRGLARHVADTLRQANHTGSDKHLLLAGPSSLATLIGAASNGSGPTVMPLWDGSTYGSAIAFGT